MNFKETVELERALAYDMLAVRGELIRAEAKHSWEGNSLEKNALILSEEAGEVSRAVLNYLEKNEPVENIRLELIQTAAMCFRLLKNLPND